MRRNRYTYRRFTRTHVRAPYHRRDYIAEAQQLPGWYTASRQADLRELIGKEYFGFDCVCLVKGILWGWNGDASKKYGGAVYQSNGVPDITEEQMINACSGVSSDFSSLVPGEFLWMQGHCGVYIGDGLAVECTPKWDNCVQITAVGNLGAKSGYNSRTWTKHGKLPYVEYVQAGHEIAAGDLVKIASDAEYYGGAAMPAWVKDQNWYVKSRDGARVVIDQNESKTNSIDSPVDVKYLTLVGAAEPEPEPAPAADTVTVELLTLRSGENRGSAQIGTVQTILKAAGLYTMDVDKQLRAGDKNSRQEIPGRKRAGRRRRCRNRHLDGAARRLIYGITGHPKRSPVTLKFSRYYFTQGQISWF